MPDFKPGKRVEQAADQLSGCARLSPAYRVPNLLLIGGNLSLKCL